VKVRIRYYITLEYTESSDCIHCTRYLFYYSDYPILHSDKFVNLSTFILVYPPMFEKIYCMKNMKKNDGDEILIFTMCFCLPS